VAPARSRSGGTSTSAAGSARDGSLAAAGVIGVEDLGRFVNDVTYLRPSMFDERAAMPVLLELLPALTDPTLVRAVAAHLRRP
jgi:hypothetical protein